MTMKTVFLLLGVAVAVSYAFAVPNPGLREMKHASDNVINTLPKEDVVYVIELEDRECKNEFFCQVEKVLSGSKGVPKLPNYSPHIENLIRRLEAYNRHHMKNCTVNTNATEIGLYQFMDSVKRCIQIHNADPKTN